MGAHDFKLNKVPLFALKSVNIKDVNEYSDIRIFAFHSNIRIGFPNSNIRIFYLFLFLLC